MISLHYCLAYPYFNIVILFGGSSAGVSDTLFYLIVNRTIPWLYVLTSHIFLTAARGYCMNCGNLFFPSTLDMAPSTDVTASVPLLSHPYNSDTKGMLAACSGVSSSVLLLWLPFNSDTYEMEWSPCICEVKPSLLSFKEMVASIFFFYYKFLEKNVINKTCRSSFEKMFLFVKIFCQRKLALENNPVSGHSRKSQFFI